MVATNQRARLQTCILFYFKLQILHHVLLLQTSAKPSKLRKRRERVHVSWAGTAEPVGWGTDKSADAAAEVAVPEFVLS